MSLRLAFRGVAPAVFLSGPIVCLVVALGLVLGTGDCTRRVQKAQVLPGPAPSIVELWQEPVDPRETTYLGCGEQGFVRSIDDRSRITFDYRGIYRDVINSVTPAGVRWACQLLSRLSGCQWREAFRTARYDEQRATRCISEIRRKIAPGHGADPTPASGKVRGYRDHRVRHACESCHDPDR